MTDPTEAPDREMIRSVLAQAGDLLGDTIALRRTLHEWPELGNELPITRDRVLESLEGLPLAVTTHESTSGIVALLEGRSRGRRSCCAATWTRCRCPRTRAWTSQSHVDGCMHACGHDTHTAMLSSAARVLSDRRDDLAGRVLFMFQPGEEGHHGRDSCSTRACSTCPPSPMARRRRSTLRSRCTSRRRCRAVGSAAGAARSWHRPTRC